MQEMEPGVLCVVTLTLAERTGRELPTVWDGSVLFMSDLLHKLVDDAKCGKLSLCVTVRLEER